MGVDSIFTNVSEKLIWKELHQRSYGKETSRKGGRRGWAGEMTEGRTKERTKSKTYLTLQLLYFGDKYLQVVTVVISPLLLPFFLSEPAHKSVKYPKQMKLWKKVSSVFKSTAVPPQHPHYCNDVFLFLSAGRHMELTHPHITLNLKQPLSFANKERIHYFFLFELIRRCCTCCCLCVNVLSFAWPFFRFCAFTIFCAY